MITKPATSNGWLDKYIGEVPENDLQNALMRQTEDSLRLFASLTDDQLDYRYAEGKWNIREIIVHLMDSERVFAYRAMCFARKDQTELPGYDENVYALNSYASQRSLKSLLEEYMVLRTSTVALFANLSPEVVQNSGIANKSVMSVSGLGFAIVGHEAHHVRVIQVRYL